MNSLGCFTDRGMVYGAGDYGPGDPDKLDGDLAEDFVRDPNPWGGISIPVALDESADMRLAWVALRDNANQRAVVVGMFRRPGGVKQVHPRRMTVPPDSGVSDRLSDTSTDILERIAAGTVAANQWMMDKAIDLINSGLRVNLGVTWFQDILATMRYLVLPVVGLMFLLRVVSAMLARSPRGLWRAVWGSALGLVLGVGRRRPGGGAAADR